MLIARYSCQILMKFEFSQHIFKHAQISNFMKIHPAGANLFHADGWMDGRMDRDRQTNRWT
jgi:hypothetical protein